MFGAFLGALVSGIFGAANQRSQARTSVRAQQQNRAWALQDRGYAEDRYSKITSPGHGTELGQHQGNLGKTAQDVMYPGTNPWERLGTGAPQTPGTAVAGERNVGAIAGAALQSRTQIQVARIQAKAQVAAATQSAFGNNISAAVNARQKQLSRENVDVPKMESDVQKADSEIKLNLQKERVESAKWTNIHEDTALKTAQVRHAIAQTNLSWVQGKEVVSKIANLDKDTKLKGAEILHKLASAKELGVRTDIQKVLLEWKEYIVVSGIIGAGGYGAAGIASIFKAFKSLPLKKGFRKAKNWLKDTKSKLKLK